MKKFAIVILIAAALAGSYFLQKNWHTENGLQGIASVNGRIEVERLDIASLYAGRVEEIYIQEGQDVSKNQPLVRLSSSQSQSQVNSAQAQIAAAEASVNNAQAQKRRATESVSRANAEIAAQQQKANIAKLELSNAKNLHHDNLISSSELERRQANYKASLAAVEAAKAEAQATITQAQATISQAEATVNQAKAFAEQADSQNDDMLIRAPLDGRIEYKIAMLGSVVGIGGKVVSLLDTSTVYLNVFLPAHQSNLVRLNDEARIKIDGSDIVFPAKVVFVASEAQFTPKSVETSEERSKLMFKIKLQIPTDIAIQHKNLLKGGMTAMGYVKYDAQASWSGDLAIKLPSDN
ncbi:HlyD family secretion protein [Actinobacillus pleuropneumoniae]|uniref:HlyD family secretion protein n=1 Tax=Actinobacillus pleuropneumoniae TaxID=715 RepID=UPI003B986A31